MHLRPGKNTVYFKDMLGCDIEVIIKDPRISGTRYQMGPKEAWIMSVRFTAGQYLFIGQI